MTVEHDGRGGYDRDDPLMAVLTGEPLPDTARTDPALLAEYRSAEADVALLREQLGIIAHALTEPEPEPDAAPTSERLPAGTGGGTASERLPAGTGGGTASERRPPGTGGGPAHRPAGAEPASRPVLPVPVRRVRGRARRVARGGLGVAAAVAVFVAMGWLVVQAGAGAGDDAASGAKADKGAESAQKSRGPLGSSAYLACTRLVAEGEVSDARPIPGTAEVRVTLEVTRSYKPAKSGTEVTFVLPADAGLDKGEQVLVAIPRGSASPDFWLVGEEAIAAQRHSLERGLGEAATAACE